MSDSILKIHQATKKFGDNPILSDINLSVKSGEFITILGPSGSGKTTLLRLMAGLETWTDGDSTKLDQIKSAFVFQEPNLLSWRTLLDNVLLPLELTRQSHDREIGMESLKQVGLEKSAHLYPHELSGGMQMRASIARALITQPQVLFMDEPFAALDEPTRENLQEQLHGLWAQKSMTMILVTHSLQEAVFLSHRIILLRGKPATVGHEYSLALPTLRNFSLRSSDLYFTELKNIRDLFHSQSTGEHKK